MEIIAAIGALGSSIVSLIAVEKQGRYARLPNWLDPSEFQREGRTADIIIAALAASFVIIIIAIIIIQTKKNG